MKQISVEEVGQALKEGKDMVLLDVRTASEYERGHIEASIHVDMDTLEKTIELIIPDKKRTIYTYCLSGSRSDVATSIMKNLGYTSVYSVKSGLLAWRANKFPLV